MIFLSLIWKVGSLKLQEVETLRCIVSVNASKHNRAKENPQCLMCECGRVKVIISKCVRLPPPSFQQSPKEDPQISSQAT